MVADDSKLTADDFPDFVKPEDLEGLSQEELRARLADVSWQCLERARSDLEEAWLYLGGEADAATIPELERFREKAVHIQARAATMARLIETQLELERELEETLGDIGKEDAAIEPAEEQVPAPVDPWEQVTLEDLPRFYSADKLEGLSQADLENKLGLLRLNLALGVFDLERPGYVFLPSEATSFSHEHRAKWERYERWRRKQSDP